MSELTWLCAGLALLMAVALWRGSRHRGWLAACVSLLALAVGGAVVGLGWYAANLPRAARRIAGQNRLMSQLLAVTSNSAFGLSNDGSLVRISLPGGRLARDYGRIGEGTSVLTGVVVRRGRVLIAYHQGPGKHGFALAGTDGWLVAPRPLGDGQRAAYVFWDAKLQVFAVAAGAQPLATFLARAGSAVAAGRYMVASGDRSDAAIVWWGKQNAFVLRSPQAFFVASYEADGSVSGDPEHAGLITRYGRRGKRIASVRVRRFVPSKLIVLHDGQLVLFDHSLREMVQLEEDSLRRLNAPAMVSATLSRLSVWGGKSTVFVASLGLSIVGVGLVAVLFVVALLRGARFSVRLQRVALVVLVVAAPCAIALARRIWQL